MGGYRIQAAPGVLVILMRHGRTAENDASKPMVRGWLDNTLSPEGRIDVQMTANKLAAHNPQWITSSDFMRDTETAKIVANRLNIANVETDWDARTWDTGEFSGRPDAEVGPAIKAIYQSPWENAPGGSESYNDFLERWQAFLDMKINYVSQVDAVRPGIIVTHGRNIASADSYYNGRTLWDADMPVPAGFATVEADDAGYLSVRFRTKKEPLSVDY